MEKYFELKRALEYIEDHLLENCTQKEIAKASFLSLSSLQKLFRCAFGYSINEYIMRRKMTLAAEELLSRHTPVQELAARYGYSTTESFSRAFRKINCCLPSEYRTGRISRAVFSPLMISEEGVSREVPILIDAIRSAENCFVMCFDVINLGEIAALSPEAADLALMQAVQRLHTHISPDMQVFRIGPDEFALITHFNQAADAEQLASDILAHNGDTFPYKGQAVPLQLRVWHGLNILEMDAQNPAQVLKDKVHRQ